MMFSVLLLSNISFSLDFLISATFEGIRDIRGRCLLKGGANFETQISGAALIRGQRLLEGSA